MKKKIDERLDSVELEGTLDSAIKYLIDLKGRYPEDVLRLVSENDVYESYSYYLVRDRLETDREYEKRLKYEKKEAERLAEQNKKHKEAEKAREKKEYERLRKKYEKNNI